jgi:predicted CXXCH cytochrome family protein
MALIAVKSDACLPCHADSAGSGNHPVGVALTRPAKPAARELLVDGKVECTTCHVAHDEPTEGRYRLRAAETTLCVACHDAK